MKKLLLLLLLPLFIFSQDSWVNVQFDFDGYADEVTWNLYNGTDSIPVASGGGYENGQAEAFHQIILDSGDYTFELLDSWGDGLGYPPDNLGWCLVSNVCQDTLFYASGNYGAMLIESLTIAPCAPPDPPVIGCMDENALNYDESADVNDEFLCEYPACDGLGEWFVDQTCDGGSALLYYNWGANPDNPNCNVIQITYGGQGTNTYSYTTDIDNGIFGIYAGNGQMPPNWEEEFSFQATFADSTQSETILYTPYPCTQGCTDENAPNYNPWATVDDGSCGGQSCDVGYTPLTIDITLDNWPGETGWSFVSGDGSMEITDGTYTFQDVGQTYTYDVCAMEGGFEFIITDTYGDGMAGSTTGGTMDGEVVITGCDGDTITTLSSGTWVNAAQENVGVGFGEVGYSTWLEVPICGGEEAVEGCTDSDYQEFNSSANVDDGSCLNEHIFGCTNENAFNYNPDATQMEIYPNCNYELWIGDAGADGWGNSFLGVVQGDNMWSFTMGPGQYEQTFPIWLETDKPVTFYYFAVGGAQTPPEEVEFQTLHNSFKLTNANGVILLYEGWNPFADNGQGALQPFQPPFFQTYSAMPFCGTLCIPTVLGCTDSTAYNYNEDANTDDGNCIPVVEGCTNDLAFNYNENANTDNGSCVSVIVGCMDEEAFNYNEEANVDDPDSCIPVIEGCMDDTQFNYNQAANTDNGSCEPFIYGCTDPTATNYNEEANTDNFSCIPFIYGCTDPAAFNYNVLANTDDDTCIAVVLGCTDTLAINTDTLANTNFGCIYPILGCTDPTSFNYDVNANTDDGSCEAVVIGCTDPTALNTDTLANTNSGCIYPSLGCTDPDAFNYDVNANVDDGSCEEVIIGCTDPTALNTDTLANTNSGCIYPILGCTDPAAFNYNVLANTNDNSCIEVVLGCTDTLAINTDTLANTNFGCIYPVLGCTDPTMFNYEVNANTDNGSCIPFIYGCTDPTMFNYDINANTDNGNCIAYVYGCTDSTAFNYDPLANTDNGSCIAVIEGCTNPIALNYNVDANVDDFSCILPIYGCTDSTALNYDENANVDNGSCIAVVEGCTDPTALNYNELANVDDFSCILPIYGCTDPEAFNYNELANIDNDSCIPVVYGCTDETAFNYNSEANTEDFSCIEVVYGCTDENSFNYDENANTDNGSCIEILEGCTDINAYNYDGNANTDDNSCEYDAECSGGPGVPYWLPNECFEWVISIDTECCTGDWNSYCIELYNYCDLGWPIDLEEFSSELLIYPNPVIDILNSNKEIDIKVYDMMGKLVIFKEKTNEIDMTNLPSGVYNLNITYNNQNINNKIIKQ